MTLKTNMFRMMGLLSLVGTATFANPSAEGANPALHTLAGIFEHDDIKILPDPVQVGELQSFEGERMPNGAWKYAAPDGLHDDCVIALAIAWQDIGGNSWLIS
jgi:hypothetical protein